MARLGMQEHLMAEWPTWPIPQTPGCVRQRKQATVRGPFQLDLDLGAVSLSDLMVCHAVTQGNRIVRLR